MTEALYHKDSYLREFTATVQAVDTEKPAVQLDRTALYPGGGGQMADTGTLTWGEDNRAKVTGTERRDGQIWYLLAPETGSLPQVGQTVQGSVDWNHRYRQMRTHTAMHILCGVIFRDYGALVTGGQMYADRARMDFEMPDLNPARLKEIEERINAEVQQSRPVSARVLPREEAFQIPDLIRTKVNLLPPGITEVRVVEIEGLDLQADGGTHVQNTREVGGIRIIKSENKGKANKRIEITLED